MKRILVIGHDGSRTGAPVLLLRLLILLKSTGKYQFDIVLRRDGPLRAEFERIGTTFVYPKPFWAFTNSLIGKGIQFLIHPLRVFKFKNKLRLNSKKADIIFANTITNGFLLKAIKKSDLKVITYVHELDYVINFYNDEKDIDFVLKTSKFLAVPCEAVKKNLIENCQAPGHKIQKLNYYIDTHRIKRPASDIVTTSKRPFTVLGCGTADWRKGFDLFYQTANKLSEIRGAKDFLFLWIGGEEKNPMVVQAHYEIKKLKLTDCVTIIPEVNDVIPYYYQSDLFLLTSREDPYPVVVLEAAAAQLPTICFDESGGIIEFVEHDAGWIVPYLDTQSMAMKIHNLMCNKSALDIAGRKAEEKVKVRHGIDCVQAQLESILMQDFE